MEANTQGRKKQTNKTKKEKTRKVFHLLEAFPFLPLLVLLFLLPLLPPLLPEEPLLLKYKGENQVVISWSGIRGYVADAVKRNFFKFELP